MSSELLAPVSSGLPARRLAAVIVSYRAPARATTAVGALASSRRPVDLVVVVDNGGAHADELRAALPRALVVSTARNLGFAAGANAGIEAALARGADAVLLLNDDAAPDPDALGVLERALSTPGVGIAAPALLRPDGRLESVGLSFTTWSGRLRELGRGLQPEPAGTLRDVDAASGCALLVGRDVLEQLHGFDERFYFYFEDLDLCLRARRAGWRVVVDPRAVVRHEGSATIGRTSAARLYHAVRGHLRVGATLGGPVTPLRQMAIVGWNLAHALRHWRRLEPGAVRAVAAGVLDHLRGRVAADVRPL